MIYIVIFCSFCCCITATVIIMHELRDINRRILSIEAEITALKNQCGTLANTETKGKNIAVYASNR